MDADFVAVGEVLLDVTLPELAAGEVRHGPIRVRAGGTAVNAAGAAAALGARAAVVGRVGRDAAAAAIRAHLSTLGIEALLADDPARPTGTFVEALGTGPRTAVADRGASDALAVDDLPVLTARGTLVSGYVLFHERTREAGRAALRAFGSRVVGVAAGSAALVGALGAAEVRRRTEGATLFCANTAEARALTGLDGEEAVLELARLFGTACVTAGPEGAVAASSDRLERAVPEAVAAGDPLGAGDALAGALVAALADGRDLAAALAAGVAAAGGVR